MTAFQACWVKLGIGRLRKVRVQRSEIDTIKYHTCPGYLWESAKLTVRHMHAQLCLFYKSVRGLVVLLLSYVVHAAMHSCLHNIAVFSDKNHTVADYNTTPGRQQSKTHLTIKELRSNGNQKHCF